MNEKKGIARLFCRVTPFAFSPALTQDELQWVRIAYAYVLCIVCMDAM